MFLIRIEIVTLCVISLAVLSIQAPVFPENRIQQDDGEYKMEPLVVESMNDLVGGFRVQQMAMSSNMLNISRRLGLAEKVAEAEKEEAEERSAEAYRAKNEARSPFIASTSLSNLGYIGRGYDIYRGNPLSDDGVVDQGFRLPVIDLPFSFRYTSDGEFRIPDNVDVISETSASFGSSFYTVRSESDYQSMLSADVSVNAEASGWGASGSFSASFSYQKQKREIENQETTSVNVVGRSIVYRARMARTAHISKVSDYFENAIIALPTENCEEDSSQDLYVDVLKDFGTHYTTEVVMGAKSVQSMTFQSSDVEKMASEGISAMVAAQLSYSSIGFSAGGGFSAGFSNNEDSRNRVQNTKKERKEYYIGGNPPSGDSSEGSTESLREWARSAAEKPVPIQYKLSSIDELIMPDFFRRLTYGFYERRKCMRQALVRFCQISIAPALCNIQTDEQRGLRRKKRQAEQERTIQFGDFVTIRNENNFLVLGGAFGFATGAATKPLVLRSQITNYDGLFQIMPVDEQSDKLQTDVHYGEPFVLKTVEGDGLFTGRLHVPDISSPSPDCLMNLDADKDDKKQIPHVGDFYIFLKQMRWTFYSVTLNVRSRQNSTFTVRLEGEEGMTETVFKVNNFICSSSPYTCHKLFVADNIGAIKKVQITGMDGRTNDIVINVRIKVVQNGKKRSYASSDIPKGNSVVFTMNEDGHKTVESDMYAVQFAFHSKVLPLNAPVQSRDLGYLHVLSSAPKQMFWGNPASHLMRAEPRRRIGIKERGPMQINPRSTECNIVIFPDDSERMSKVSVEFTSVVVSFDVTCMVNGVEMNINNRDISQIEVKYIDRNSNDFQKLEMSSMTVQKFQSVTSLKLNQGMYATAIKLSTVSGNISDIINTKTVSVLGCPSAIYESGNKTTEEIEWSIQLSENEIQTYPYLGMVTTHDEKYKMENVLKRLDKNATDTLIYSFPIDNDCSYTSEVILTKLRMKNQMSVVQFQNLEAKKKGNNLNVKLVIVSLNERERNMALMHMKNDIKMVVESIQCANDHIQLHAVVEEPSIQTSSIAVIALLVVLLVITLAVLAFFIHRSRKCSSSSKEGQRNFADRWQTTRDGNDSSKDVDIKIYENRQDLDNDEDRYVMDVQRPAT